MFRNWISSRRRTAHGVSIASQSVGRSLLLLLHPVSNRCCGLWEGMGGTFRPNTFFPCSLTHSLTHFRLRRSRHCGHEYITNELPPHTGPTLRPAPPTLPSWHRSTSRPPLIPFPSLVLRFVISASAMFVLAFLVAERRQLNRCRCGISCCSQVFCVCAEQYRVGQKIVGMVRR